MGRVLWLVLLIVEIGAAVGWIGIVLGWAARQSRTDRTIPSPRDLYGVGLPVVAALAIVVHMAVDPTSPLHLWWIPMLWLVLAMVMVYVRRVQLRPRHRQHDDMLLP